MQFNISKEQFSNDRISINTDDVPTVKNVKIYETQSRSGKLFAKLACVTGYAITILGTDGNTYVVNQRSLGKAFAAVKGEQQPVTKKVKDTFAELFFKEAKEGHLRSEFIKELGGLILEQRGNAISIIHELRALNRLFTKKAYLNTVQERQLYYDKIRGALLDDFSKDEAWKTKVNGYFPPRVGMEKKRFEEFITMLRQIKLPEEYSD